MITFIVAIDKNHGIGKNNVLPWYLPEDLKYFKEETTGKTIVMGRKTFESIGKALPNRKNIILTRKQIKIENCETLNSFESLLNSEDDIYIIGGAEVFKQFMKYADRLLLTYIDYEFDCDTFFEWQEDDWKMVSNIKGKKDNKNPYDYYFREYIKVKTQLK